MKNIGKMKIGDYEISFKNLRFRSWLTIVISLTSIIVLPLALWKDYTDGENLKNRKKFSICRVIALKGLKRNTAVVEYYIGNERVEQVRSAPFIPKVHLGDRFKITYDSLDYENIEIIWESPSD